MKCIFAGFLLLASIVSAQDPAAFKARMLAYQDAINYSKIETDVMVDLTSLSPEGAKILQVEGFDDLNDFWKASRRDPTRLFLSRSTPNPPEFHKAGTTLYGLLYVEEKYVDLRKKRAVFVTKETLVGVKYPRGKWKKMLRFRQKGYAGKTEAELVRSNFPDFPAAIKFADPVAVSLGPSDPSMHPALAKLPQPEPDPPDIVALRVETLVERALAVGDFKRASELIANGKEELGASARLLQYASLTFEKFARYEVARNTERLKHPTSRLAAMVALLEIASFETRSAKVAKSTLAPFSGSEELKQAESIASKLSTEVTP